MPAAEAGERRRRSRQGRDGGVLRGDEPLDLRAGSVQFRRAGRRQHDAAGGGRDAGSEGTLARSHRARRGAVRLRDDRAASGRRLRSVDDPDPGREARRLLRGERPQMVHHRRRGSRPFHARRAHLGRPAPRPDRLPLPQGPARLAHPAPHPDHGAGGARRPLRARVRRARDSGRERSPRRRARA